MAITKISDFVENLSNLDVVGVNRRYKHPPASVDSADLPVMYPRIPSTNSTPLTFTDQGGWPTLRADLVVLTRMAGEDTQSENFAETLAMMDEIATALRTTTNLGNSKITFRIYQTVVEVAGHELWAVITEVEGKG